MVTRTSWFLTAVVVASCLVGRHAEAQPAGDPKPPQPEAAAAAEGDADAAEGDEDDPYADAADPDAAGDAANEADEGSEQRAASDAPARKPAEPQRPALDGPVGLQLHHAPLSVAEPHSELSIPADIEHPQLVRRAVLVYRLAGETELRETEFKRSPTGKYAAVIPAEQLKWPGFAYAIEVEQTDGSRVAAFASRESLHEVQVPEDLEDVRERVLDQRVDGRRSVFASSAEYVSFGRSQAETVDASGNVITESVPDWYYRLEGSYTYRPLRIVSEFSLRIGVVRGRSPVPLDSEEPDQDIDDRRKVGLNYGAPTVRFRLHDIVQLEGEGFLSITEVGFSAGGGAARGARCRDAAHHRTGCRGTP